MSQIILVTGGAGYIGSHTTRELLNEGYEVIIVDNFQTGHKESIDERCIVVDGDIRDPMLLSAIFSTYKVDAVVHFAANIEAGESMRDPLKFYNNNTHGTEVLLSVMRKHGVDKIVFSSTAAVYGNKDEVITETSSTEPTNAYGETKLAMEKMMKWCDVAYGLKYVALRYFNVAGADESGLIGEDHSPETHLIPLILQVALGKRKSISVYGNDYPTRDGTCIRDYIHVTDLAKAHVLALQYILAGNPSDHFNLGTNNGFSVLEMIETAREVCGEEIPAIIEGRRAGDPAMLIASSEKAKKVLGWKPEFTSVRDVIASAWEWHSNNPEGYVTKALFENRSKSKRRQKGA